MGHPRSVTLWLCAAALLALLVVCTYISTFEWREIIDYPLIAVAFFLAFKLHDKTSRRSP